MKLPIDLFKRKRKQPSGSAEAAKRPKHKGMSVGAVGMLAFLLAGILTALTATGVYRVAVTETDRWRDEGAVRLAENAAERISAFLRVQSNTLEVLAKNPELAPLFEQQPEALRHKHVESLSRYFSDSIRLRLLSPEVRDVDMEAVPPISYSVLESLRLAAAGTSASLAEAHLVGTPRQHVNLVQRVESPDDGRVVGFLVASFGLPVLEELLGGVSNNGGYFELQQPAPEGEPLVLATVGNPARKAGPAASRLPTVPGSRWHLAFWSNTAKGRLSAEDHRNVLIVVAAGLALLGLVLFAVFRWFGGLLVRDHTTLDAMLEDLQAGRRRRHPHVRLAACRPTTELIRDISQTGIVTAVVPAAHDDVLPEEVIADPLVESIEPDGGMFGVEEVSIDPTIFRKYDIRGVVETSLTPEVVYETGRAIGSAAAERGEQSVIVGRDGRLSGPELVDALTQGLVASGRKVIDIGAVPTPLVYFATNVLDCRSSVMVTGSHNPPEYNGMKIVLAGETLAEEGIQDLYRRIQQGGLTSGEGARESEDILPAYIKAVTGDVRIDRPLKVVVDCGNGIAGMAAPELLRTLGCEVIELYCEVDGSFPNHHPDPGKPENLADLVQAVARHEAELGLAFDGDGDRLGVVVSDGGIIWPDRLLMLFAMDILNRNEGAEIIYDVKCSRHLARVISDFGGKPLMWRTGHSLIKAKMKEDGALLAGEMSGHIFFKERWYGFDDALYSAARLLEILSGDPRDSAAVFRALPDSVNTPEINVSMAEGEPAGFMEKLLQSAQFDGAEIATIDGLRADFADGWGLVRASNTTPCLVLRFEADSEEALARIQEEFRKAMVAAKPDIELPF